MSWLLPEIRAVESAASRWDARWKLASIAASMMLVSAIDAWPVAALAFASSVGATLWARLPWMVTVRAVGSVTLPLAPWFAALPILQGWSGADEAALWLARLSAVACLGALLVHSTGLPRLLEAASALPVPRLLVRVAHFAHRFTVVLTAELRRLRIALHARGFRMRTSAHCHRTLGAVVGGSIVRSEARAERVAQAMTCRGFRGDLPLLTPFRTTPRDVVLACGFLLVSAGLACASLPARNWWGA